MKRFLFCGFAAFLGISGNWNAIGSISSSNVPSASKNQLVENASKSTWKPSVIDHINVDLEYINRLSPEKRSQLEAKIKDALPYAFRQLEHWIALMASVFDKRSLKRASVENWSHTSIFQTFLELRNMVLVQGLWLVRTGSLKPLYYEKMAELAQFLITAFKTTILPDLEKWKNQCAPEDWQIDQAILDRFPDRNILCYRPKPPTPADELLVGSTLMFNLLHMLYESTNLLKTFVHTMVILDFPELLTKNKAEYEGAQRRFQAWQISHSSEKTE